MSEQRDLVIIGSGPGGYVAAIRAGQLGLNVAVVEKDDRFGGTCTLRGCIPTKALLHTASLLDDARAASTFGVRLSGAPELDVAQAHAHKRKIVDASTKGISYLFKKNNVEGLHGMGRLVGPNEVEVENDGLRTVYEAKHILIATGSVPRELPFARSNGRSILTSDHILELEKVPRSIAVLGSGAVGCEFASIFSSWGSEVRLIEMLPRLLPIEDEEVSKELERAFRKRKIDCRTSTKLQEVESLEDGVRLRLEGDDGKQETLEAELLLIAVGRAPVTEKLGLAEVGVTTEKGFIPVNSMMQTAVPHIYAIGDVIDTPMLAHVATAEALVAVEHMAGAQARPLHYERVPSCTYCEPEVASVGLTESTARDRGYEVGVGKFPFSALGKARILGKTTGFTKIVRETQYDEVLGVHIIGAHATDLIAEACAALQLEATTEEILHTIHAHPTLSESVGEAAHVALGMPIHI
jgi:dihydrolipoamide dehydrogenase